MKIIGIIPARYNSTRLPGKPLKMIKGISMIQRVFDQAMKAKSLSSVYVATDDEKVYDHVKLFTDNVIMTSPNHQNGTERCAEVVNLLGEKFDFVINIQGDEPFISPLLLDELSETLNKDTEIATAVNIINEKDEIKNPNVVKAVLSKSNKALYFSRSEIPFLRDESQKTNLPIYYKHVGIYAFKTSVLTQLVNLPESMLEQSEKLEQLRWLENDYKIDVLITKHQTKGIDTLQDLEEANN